MKSCDFGWFWRFVRLFGGLFFNLPDFDLRREPNRYINTRFSRWKRGFLICLSFASAGRQINMKIRRGRISNFDLEFSQVFTESTSKATFWRRINLKIQKWPTFTILLVHGTRFHANDNYPWIQFLYPTVHSLDPTPIQSITQVSVSSRVLSMLCYFITFTLSPKQFSRVYK